MSVYDNALTWNALTWVAPYGTPAPDLDMKFRALPVAYLNAGLAYVPNLGPSVEQGKIRIEMLELNGTVLHLCEGGQFAVVIDAVRGKIQSRYCIPAATFSPVTNANRAPVALKAVFDAADVRSVSARIELPRECPTT